LVFLLLLPSSIVLLLLLLLVRWSLFSLQSFYFIDLAYEVKDIVFRFIIEYSSLMNFGPLGDNNNNNNRSIFLYEDFWKMIFWLVLKLEISYRVMILWRILVSFRGFFFEDYIIFAWWNILNFHNNSSFALRYIYFLMQMTRPRCDTPHPLLQKNKNKIYFILLYIYIYINDLIVMFSHDMWSCAFYLSCSCACSCGWVPFRPPFFFYIHHFSSSSSSWSWWSTLSSSWGIFIFFVLNFFWAKLKL